MSSEDTAFDRFAAALCTEQDQVFFVDDVVLMCDMPKPLQSEFICLMIRIAQNTGIYLGFKWYLMSSVLTVL